MHAYCSELNLHPLTPKPLAHAALHRLGHCCRRQRRLPPRATSARQDSNVPAKRKQSENNGQVSSFPFSHLSTKPGEQQLWLQMPSAQVSGYIHTPLDIYREHAMASSVKSYHNDFPASVRDFGVHAANALDVDEHVHARLLHRRLEHPNALTPSDV